MKLKKILALLLVAVIPFSSLVGCKEPDDETASLEITAYDAGYGTAFVDNIAAAFEEETGTDVTVLVSADQSKESNYLAENNHTSDIVFIGMEMYKYAEEGNIADITDLVYKKVPYGAEEGSKTIEELCKYSPAMNLNKEGKYYYVSYAAGIEGLLCNETAMDEVFGAGEWTQANTTDELMKLFDGIKPSDKAYAMVATADYLDFLVQTWWAQYDGYNSYFDYWRGYKDGQFCKSSPEMLKTDGRLEALKVLEKAVRKDNQYMHEATGTFFQSTYFKQGQMSFTGAIAFNGNTKKAAYYPCGDWFENEMGSEMNNQTVKMIKVPVISSIKNTFEDATDKAMTDAKLSEIISKIDAGTAFSEETYGCKKATYDKVYEARNMVLVNGPVQQAFIPESSENKEIAADFIRFMISDKGQSIYAQEMKGLTMCYGYDPTTDEDVTMSDFAKSIYDMTKGADTKFIYRDVSQTLANRGGIPTFTTNQNKYFQKLYVSVETDGGMTAQQIYDDTYKTINDKWSQTLTDAGLN